MRKALAAIALVACHHAAPAHGDRDAAIVPDATPDAGACGIRGGARGLQMHSAMLGGLSRTWLAYLPSGVDTSTPLPLVVVFHGYTMSGQAMSDVTGYQAIADAQHVALAFPDGVAGPNSLGAPWNVGTNVCPSSAGAPPDATGDDLAFFDAIRADVSQDQCLDLAHVYVTGFSMGGYFTHHVGCERGDVRAVAPHSGGTHALDTCAVTRKPIIMFHGLSDPVIPDGCDDPSATNTPMGFTASASEWAAHNGCASTVTTMPVQGGRCIYYDGCPTDGQVALCTFDNMGHCWAGGVGSSIAACGSYASATELSWEFFQKYAW
jgi:polyhydroxybutyrate depolymerase